jgi:hypothetical protein
MAHSAAVTGRLDELVRTEEHVVGYSGDEVGEAGGIRIYVDEEGSPVPDEVAGLPVAEVVAIGRPQLKSAGVAVGVNPKTTVRPLRGGISISGSGSGTLGYFVKIDGKLALMSAAHVLKTGTKDVIQPSFNDGGQDPRDLVAKLTLSIFEPGNGVDAASAKLEDKIGAELILNDIGRVTGTTKPVKDDSVKKSGKNTGVTTGTVNDLNGNIDIDGDMYRHMIGVKAGAKPFSVGGDSGSLVVKGSAAIGVLAGGTDTQDWVCYIDAVLTKLNATLAT